MPTHTYTTFSYTQETSNRLATPIPSSVASKTYAPGITVLSTLLPTTVSYTTYSLDAHASGTENYGGAAYFNLWKSITYSNTVLPITTTVSPAPIATSKLVFPPALYKACPDFCLNSYCIPDDFVWGVASSAWQVEGAPLSEGRGPSSLDLIGATLSPGTDSANLTDLIIQPLPGANDSVVTALQYFLYKEDIARIAAIGIPYYSFTISWTRIIPFGDAGSPINQPGLDHYEDVIKTCLDYGVQPVITLVHADLPLHLRVGSSGFPKAFLYFAQQVMTRFADRVPIWITFNEANVNLKDYADQTNILLAHAMVYRLYKDQIRGTGRITIKFSHNVAFPLDPSNPSDVAAAARYQDFVLGVQANPLFLGENYPESILSTKGITLTPLSPANQSYIAHTVDFISVDPYTAQFATSPPNGIDACAANPSDPLYPGCIILSNVQSNGWINGDQSYQWDYLTPQYFRQHLNYIWNTYRPSGIAITEFGFNPFMEYARTVNAQRYDLERAEYYVDYLSEMLKAMYEDGVNVIGAFAWSIVDNNEFGSYEQQYGMQVVNRTDPMLRRTFKRSIFDFVDFFQKRQKGGR